MKIFELMTPVTYWLLIIMWIFILSFYIKRLLSPKLESRLFTTLLIILAIDAFRTLFESLYFGAWYTSRSGLLPVAIFEFLVRPENVFIPKILNVIAAALIIVILLRRWLPQEEHERIRQQNQLQELERRTLELKATNNELEAFSYSVSHDLRAPLRGIDGFSHILLEDYEEKLDEQGKDYLHRVRAASQRMG